jgi:hypothetical protein
MPKNEWTEKQGQHLAFIYNYTVIHGEPPAEADMQRFFRVRPPTVHQMVLRLDEKGLISREPGKPRTIRVLIPPEEIPLLKDKTRKKVESRGSIYQLKITLQDIKPPIWRRVLVPSDITLNTLHYVIQMAMGWTNSHLHQFIVGKTYFSEPIPAFESYRQMLDDRKVRLAQIAKEGGEFIYEYDFGDSWRHVILVEKVLEPEPGQQYPVCIEGKRACPPEDVGGEWGYNTFLEAIQDPDHPEHEMYIEWIGYDFDPEVFDREEANEFLRELR